MIVYYYARNNLFCSFLFIHVISDLAAVGTLFTRLGDDDTQRRVRLSE